MLLGRRNKDCDTLLGGHYGEEIELPSFCAYRKRSLANHGEGRDGQKVVEKNIVERVVEMML